MKGLLDTLLAENALLVTLVAALGAFLLLVGPALLVQDSWLALIAGREIVDHGLPAHDSVVVMTHGARWVDQQWLAQLLFYGSWKLGGVRLAVILDIALVVAAIGSAVVAARRRGASPTSVLLVTALCLFVAPWSWQLRPQTLALPLFVALLYLLTQDVRQPSRRALLVFPLLVLWANLHGTVVFAAALTVFAGLAAIVRDRRLTARAAAFVLLPAPCTLASPYAPHLPAYFKLMLVDPPFARFIVEWQWARPSAATALFYILFVATVVLVVRGRRTFTSYELLVLAFTGAEAVHSVRAIALFVLAAQVLLPTALDRALGDRKRRTPSRLGARLAVISVAALLISLVAASARSNGWYQRYWSEDAAAAVASQPQARVFPSDRYADWLIWKLPSLRGRTAYDVRFELLDKQELDALYRFSKMRGADWGRVTVGYNVVVLDLPRRRKQLHALLAQQGVRLLYEKEDDVAVLARSSG